MIIDIAIQGHDTESPSISLVTPRAWRWARAALELPAGGHEEESFSVAASDLDRLMALARSAGLRIGVLHHRDGHTWVSPDPGADAPRKGRASRARTTVYYTVVDEPPPRSGRRMQCGWAAWWTGDPRRGTLPEPDATGAAPERETVREYVFEYLRVLHGVTARLVEVDVPIAWASPRQKARGRKAPRRRAPPRRERAAIPDWAVALGLDFPCTEDDVRRAYRRSAFEHHPDRGGSQERFVALGHARDAALAALGGAHP